MTNINHWMGVVSAEHVARGVAGGFAQLCHGKEAPLRRMRPGDWLVYYSPTSAMRGSDKLQSFTALGQVEDAPVLQIDEGAGWTPHRRKVRYEAVRPVPIAALASRLHLTARPNWGMALRRGHLALGAHDFEIIAQALRARPG